MSLSLSILEETLVVVRFDSFKTYHKYCNGLLEKCDETNSSFVCLTRTSDEVSLVCCQSLLKKFLSDDEDQHGQDINDGGDDDAIIRKEFDWRAIKVDGPLDFSLVGILRNLSVTLADAGISIFAISTYDTDYILVKQKDMCGAIDALEMAGHQCLK